MVCGLKQITAFTISALPLAARISKLAAVSLVVKQLSNLMSEALNRRILSSARLLTMMSPSPIVPQMNSFVKHMSFIYANFSS